MHDELNILQDPFAVKNGGDTLHEECGVVGIYAPGENVARQTFFALFALQHRGQESAGIAVSDGQQIRLHKEMGLVTQCFDEEVLKKLKGDIAIGHVRYSTTGSSILCNAQPLMASTPDGTVVIGHNGNLVNTTQIREELEAQRIPFETTNDSEVVAKLVAFHRREMSIEDAVTQTMREIKGAYSICVMTEDKLIAIRDPFGVRPLCIGSWGNGQYIVASETCALNVLGARFVREVEPGEMIIINKRDFVRSRQCRSNDAACASLSSSTLHVRIHISMVDRFIRFDAAWVMNWPASIQ